MSRSIVRLIVKHTIQLSYAVQLKSITFFFFSLLFSFIYNNAYNGRITFVTALYVHDVNYTCRSELWRQKCSTVYALVHSEIEISTEWACAFNKVAACIPLVTTRPIPYLHRTSSVLRRWPLELLSVT